MFDATGTYWYHNDHLGTPQVLTNAGQQVVWKADYEAFGGTALQVNIVDNPLRLPGQYADAQVPKFNYNWWRNYDVSTGRYISSDPIGLEGGRNTYSYVLANPARSADPLGLDSEFCVRSLLIPVPYAQHCFVRYNGDNKDTQSYDDRGVHPDPKPEAASCRATRGNQDDDCLRREMSKCKAADYGVVAHNCCHCVEDAMKACGLNIPANKYPNYPINPGPQFGEPGYKPARRSFQ